MPRVHGLLATKLGRVKGQTVIKSPAGPGTSPQLKKSLREKAFRKGAKAKHGFMSLAR